MLQIKNLYKTYKTKGEQTAALQNINLEFGNTGFVMLTGKSGSGKSTLLNVLGGLDSFERGEIIINGESTNNFSANNWDSYRNTYVGTVFQEFYLIDEFSVGKNIALALELQGFHKGQIESRVKAILSQVDLSDYEKRLPRELSGGQKQRIAIARALIKNPQIILADEPTGNLDSETGRLILKTLKKLSETKLVIMVTHDTEFAKEFGERMIELKDGVVINDFINQKESGQAEGNEFVKAVIKLPKDKDLSLEVISHLNRILTADTKDHYLIIGSQNRNNVALIGTNKDDRLVSFSASPVNERLILNKTALPLKEAFKLSVNSIFKKKIRLLFMTVLFVLALMLVGVAMSFAFIDVPTVTALTYKNADIFEVPLVQYNCNGNHCSFSTGAFPQNTETKLRSDFPGLKFVDNYDRYTDFNELFSNLTVMNLSSYYQHDITRLTLIDSSLDGFELRYGSSPSLHEVLITDYLADTFIAYQVFNGIRTEPDLIGKTFTYTGHTVRISGIVKTDYHKYDYGLVDPVRLEYSSDFSKDSNNLYLRIFMNQDTYNNDFAPVRASLPFIIQRENGTSGNIYGISAIADDNNQLLGNSRMPQNDSEIAVSYDTLKNYISGYNPNLSDTDNANHYLNSKLTLSLDEPGGTQEKEYTIVGAFLDKTVNFLFTPTEFKRLLAISGDSHSLSVMLTGSKEEQIRFFREADSMNVEQITNYYQMFSTLKNMKTGMQTGLTGAGIVFSLFASLLIYSFISASIEFKQKEIGTLRAIGARGIDVSKIFISESLVIAFMTAVLSNLGIYFFMKLMNRQINSSFDNKLILLYMSAPVVFIVLAIAIFIVTISAFIPVKRITLMKPIQAIKHLK